MKNLTLSEIQKEVDDWANQFEKPYFGPLSMVAALTEELGEVARVMNIMYGDKNKKDSEAEKHLENEVGDLFFSLICLANSEKIDLTGAFNKNMDKLNSRDKNRWKKKDVEIK
jgi:NTP pyrophosphatase (non-canonical NTP hydrolase)